MSWLRKSLCALAVAGASGLSATGCETNEGIVFIMGVLATEATDCVAEPEAEATLLAGGTLDRALRGPGSYQAWLLVASQLTQRGSREQIRNETNYINLEGAEITIETTTGQRVDLGGPPNPFSTFGNGVVTPSSGSAPGLGVMLVDLLPANIPLQNGTVLVRVRAFGTTLGGTAVESNDYVFPITLCDGCLIDYPASAADETTAPGMRYFCSQQGGDDAEVTSCFPGLNAVIPCNACSASNEVCHDPCQNCSRRAFVRACDNVPSNCP